jgi:Leucine-rich repeat (LRR) protein
VRPIGTLKNLKYLEIFSTDVTNYWPLINCTSLEDLNLSFSGHGDITPLLQMPWLNRLWLSCNKEVFSEEEKATLAQHLPNTIMVFSSGSATNKGWRNSPNYYAMRDFLGTGYMVA